MDIKNLNTFIQVAELLSFTQAAEKLGYSQSTVSFQIRQLENELGVSLFDRINHTIALTHKGREMLQYAHEIMKIAGDMEKAASGDREIGGLVRIAIAQSLCDWLLTERFAALHRAYPGITMKIIAGDTEEMFRLLGRNEADIVFTLDNIETMLPTLRADFDFDISAPDDISTNEETSVYFDSRIIHGTLVDIINVH